MTGSAETQEQRWAAAAYTWLEKNIPKSGRGKVAMLVFLGVLLLGLIVFMLALPRTATNNDDPVLLVLNFTALFLICFASAAFILFPIPGLSLVALAVVFQQGGHYEPLLVAAVAALGWTLGDTTVFVAGAVGSESIEKQVKIPERFKGIYESIVTNTEKLMKRFGFWILIGVTAIPNPVIAVALLAAGSNLMKLPLFLTSVGIGRFIRALIAVSLGAKVIS